jgi:hypothetical protein
VLAHSEQRARSICEGVSKVTEKLFWFGSLTNALEDRLHAPVWLRSRDKQTEPFLGATS